MSTYALWFFLVAGTWVPGWDLEGWAPAEVVDGITRCEQAKSEAETINLYLKKSPEDFEGVGKVSGVFVKCIQVVFPKEDKPA